MRLTAVCALIFLCQRPCTSHRRDLPVAGIWPTDNGMYETRFGLHRKPFQAVLTSDDFYRSDVYEDLSSTVIHALRSDLGVAVLTGPSGIGKTVTLDSIRRAMSAENQVMVLRGGTVSSGEDLLHALHRRLLPPPGKKFDSSETRGTAAQAARWEVIERMQKVSDFWGPTIVLLDDAHLATPELFVELRALMEEESDGQRLLRVMIAGPLSLEEFLATSPLQDFSQKIRTHRFLEPLTSAQSVAYLDHQMQRVGGDTAKIFESAALERIVAAADGVPRCLDLLADESLMAAFRTEQDVVSVAAVDDGLSRLRHLPYAWNVSQFSAAAEEESIVESTTTAVVSHGVIEVGGPARDASEGSSFAVEIGGDVDHSGESAEGISPDESEQPAATAATDVSAEDVRQTATDADAADADATAARFDRIFQSISLGDAGRVAVAPVARRTGIQANDDEAASTVHADATASDAMATGEIASGDPVGAASLQDDAVPVSTSAEVRLEHHLILPHSGSDEDSGEEPSATQSSEDVSASSSVLDRYEPWTPAGTWSGGNDGSASGQTVASRSSNASPVFDRYTWCEMGRALGPDPVNRSPVSVTEAGAPQWPPVVSGLAPAVPIPIESVVSDEGRISEDECAAVATLPVSPGMSQDDMEPVGVDPTESIEAIEDLLSLDEQQDSPSTDRMFTLPIDLPNINSRPADPHPTAPPTSEPGPQAELVFESELPESVSVVAESESAGQGEESETLHMFRSHQSATAVRRSVVSVAAEQMKMAAGAESLSQSALNMTDEGQEVESPAPSSGRGGFANLFTRLRRGRSR